MTAPCRTHRALGQVTMKRTIGSIGVLVCALWCLAGCCTQGRFGATTTTMNTAHFCSCVMENPSAYNDLLHAADVVNSLIESNTVVFLESRGLWAGDFNAAFIVQQNGDWEIKVWCSNRARAATAARTEYEAAVAKWCAPYDAALNRAHDNAQNHESNTPAQGLPHGARQP